MLYTGMCLVELKRKFSFPYLLEIIFVFREKKAYETYFENENLGKNYLIF
jgi:hypothetical protein